MVMLLKGNMIFLVISQRAIPNPNYSLKDLEGHGRFDIICRCILSATRRSAITSSDSIVCFLKGGDGPAGWITWNNNSDGLNEISIAHQLAEKWDQIFTRGKLQDLLAMYPEAERVLLDERGISFEEISFKLDNSSVMIILGAQQDLTSDDLEICAPMEKIKLGNESLLASHAITLIRELTAIN